jgi:predicted dehydrogenase
MDKIRVGLIGVGGISGGHITRLLALPEVEIAALVDIKENRLAHAVANHDGALEKVSQFSDYRTMLESTKPDAVLICTPHTQHFQQAMDSLDAGAHVLLEKPMVTRVVDAHALIKKINETKKVVGLSYQRHTDPRFRYIREQIASGIYGEVQFVNALQQQGWKKGTAGSWRQDIGESGGGQINDSGSHLLDIILWTTGLAPDAVSAFMDNKGTPVDINSAVTVRFTSGAQGTISVVGDAAGWHEDITIWCENGTFYIREGQPLIVQGLDGKKFEPDESTMHGASNVDLNFIRTIQGVETIAANPIDGLHTIELTEAAWKSAEAGGALTEVVRS